MRRGVLACVALALLGVAAFMPVLGADFTNWDDLASVVENPRIARLSPDNLLAMWRGPGAILVGLYIPVTQTSFAMDRTLFGPGPVGFHAVNLALHVAAGMVLFLFLRAFLESALAAFLAAAVFVVHPAQVESVAWISERKSVLSGLLIFLALHLYVRRTSAGPRAFSFRAEWPALLLTALALLAKPIAVVIPPILAVLDLTRPGARAGHREWVGPQFARDLWRSGISKTPYLLLAAAATAATIAGHGLQGGLPEEPRDPLSVAATMLSVVPRYLRIALFPTSLSAIDTPPVLHSLAAPGAVAGLALLLAGAAAVLHVARRSRVTAFFSVWALAAILPVSNVVQLDVYMADRYLYLPIVALAAPMALALVGALESRGRALAGAACAVLAILCFTALSNGRSRVWHDSLSLWTDTIAKSPGASKAHNNLGLEILKSGDAEGAEAHFRQAVRLDGAADAWLNLGIALSQQGRAADALAAFDRGRERWPGMPDVDFWRGRMLLALGRPEDAGAAYRAEIARRPGFVPAWIDLATVLAGQGRLEDALGASERAATIEPDNPEALLNVGLLRWQVRRDAAGARSALERSLALAPGQPKAALIRQLLSGLPPSPGVHP